MEKIDYRKLQHLRKNQIEKIKKWDSDINFMIKRFNGVLSFTHYDYDKMSFPYFSSEDIKKLKDMKKTIKLMKKDMDKIILSLEKDLDTHVKKYKK